MMQPRREAQRDIVDAYRHARPIAREDVLRWMASSEIEDLGATFHFIASAANSNRISPVLTFEECHQFAMQYLARCIVEDPEGEWSDSRYAAAEAFTNWFRGCWRDPAVRRSALSELRDWIAGLYREGDDDVRECIVNGALEHLLSDRDIADFFSSWQSDPALGTAYARAIEWDRP